MSRANPTRRVAMTGLVPPGELLHDRGHEFRTARRHSRRVRLLRWLLPSMALSGLAVVLLIVWFDPLRFYRSLPVEFGRISITDNKLTIEAPKLTGFTQDRRPYWVTAEQAAQDLGSPNRIELSGITGQVELANRGESRLSATSGLYDMKAGTLHLSKGIEIGATGGYKMEMNDAMMHVRKGTIVTDKPVKAIFPDGFLAAQRLEILEHGDRVNFSGGVVMTFKIPHDGDGAKQTKTVDAKR